MLNIKDIRLQAENSYDLEIPGHLSTADKRIDLGGVFVDYDDVDS